MENELQIINLDNLNMKQKLKEYKLASKEIKAKDSAKKKLAIEKFKDERYFLESDCLVSLIESMAPKKKTLDLTKLLIECLITFLEKEKNNEKLCYISIENIFKSTGTLEIFQTLSDVMMYEEEIKIKKKKKTDEPEQPIDPTPEIIKYYAMKSYSIISNTLFKYSYKNKELLIAFASITNILSHHCNILLYLYQKYLNSINNNNNNNQDKIKEKDNILQGCLWVLDTISICLRYSNNINNSIELFLSFPNIISIIKTLSNIETLTLSSLNILEYLMTIKIGLNEIMNNEFIDHILNLCQISSNKIENYLQSSSTDKKNTKGKDNKGNSKTNKNNSSNDLNQQPTNLTNEISILSINVKIFIIISNDAKEYYNINSTLQILKILSLVLLNPTIWTQCNTISLTLQYPDLTLFIRESGILLGSLGLVSNEIRDNISKEGGIRLILQLLKNSSIILGYSSLPPEPVKGAPPSFPPLPILDNNSKLHLSKFRHTMEKSLLHLLSIQNNDFNNNNNNNNNNKSRWNICDQYLIDIQALKSSIDLIESTEPQISNLGYILEIMKHNDEDLSNRATRIISSIIQSISDPIELFKSLQLYNIAVTNLSIITQKHGNLIINEIDQLTLLKLQQQQKEEEQQQQQNEQEEIIKNENNNNNNNENNNNNSNNNTQNLTSQITFCHSLISLEYFLKSDYTPILTFSTEEQLNILSGLLYRCGPIRGKYLIDPTITQLTYSESIISLYDLRYHDWNGQKNSDHNGNNIILRELIFDILSIIVSSDSKYRTYPDIQPPQQPCTPFPSSTCPCADEALRVIRICSNPCLATIQCRTSFKLDDLNYIIASPETNLLLNYNLLKPVCEAGLKFLTSIGSIGVKGFEALYSSIAKFGFSKNEEAHSSFIPAMSLLKDFFSHKIIPIIPVDSTIEQRNSPDPIESNFTWTLPIYTDLNIKNQYIITHSLEILYRKDIWPYLTVIGPLLGLLASPNCESSTMKYVLDTISAFSNIKTISPVIQPAVVDIFSGCLLGLGGAVIIAGSIGRYGPLYQYDNVIDILHFILERGKLRQEYWDEYKKAKLVAEAAEVDIKGKGNKKDTTTTTKDKGKDKSKGKGKLEEEIIILPYEPDSTHNDPNHGPDQITWSLYLNIQCDELHSITKGAQPLTICVQSGLISIAIDLISIGANINQIDSNGLSALCHSFILREKEITQALLNAGADVDLLDRFGNPTIKYAYFSLSNEQLSNIYKNYINNNSNSNNNDNENENNNNNKSLLSSIKLNLNGNPYMIDNILEMKVDLNVCDFDGNYPLHYLCGLGTLEYTLGGILLKIQSGLQSNEDIDLVSSIETLVLHGAKIEISNKKLITILHVVSALGDIKSVNKVLQLGHAPNVEDDVGYLPFHYATSSCTDNSINIANILLKVGVRRQLSAIPFDNNRTGKSKQEKYLIDSQKVLNKILSEVTCPPIIKVPRLTLNDILNKRSIHGLSPSLLSLCGGLLSIAPAQRCLVEVPKYSIKNRLDMFEFLQSKYEGNVSELIEIQEESSLSTSPVYTSSPLSPSLILSQNENFKQGNSILSSAVCLFIFFLDYKVLNQQSNNNLNEIVNLPLIQSLLSLSFQDSCYTGDLCYTYSLRLYDLPSPWTILHLGILLSSTILMDYIWDNHLSIFKFPYTHYLASYPNKDLDESILTNIIQRASLTPIHGSLLNASSISKIYPKKPLHIAINNKNLPFMKIMFQIPRVDLNVTDNDSGQTLIHTTCQKYVESCNKNNDNDLNIYSEMLNLFLSKKKDLKLLIEDKLGETVIDYVIREKNNELLKVLLEINKNQVLERILYQTEENKSLLWRLEDENIKLCNELGIFEIILTDDNELVLLSSENNEEQKVDNNLNENEQQEQEKEKQEEEKEKREQEEEKQRIQVQLKRKEQIEYQIKQNQEYLKKQNEKIIKINQEKLNKNNKILSIILLEINELSLEEEFHKHKCFYEGKLYEEYCYLVNEIKIL